MKESKVFTRQPITKGIVNIGAKIYNRLYLLEKMDTSKGRHKLASGPGSRGRERHAYERYPINLAALVSSHGSVASRCVVRDFCVGGMYIACEHAPVGAKVAHLSLPLKDDQISIECWLEIAGNVHSLSFIAQVVRQQGAGLAVRFLNSDLEALQILLNYAQFFSQKGSQQNGADAQKASLSAENFKGKRAADIIEYCNQMANDAAVSLIVRFHEEWIICSRYRR